LAAKEASETKRGVVIQDTAWDGYEEIPAWIMEGYGTMAMEAGQQLQKQGCQRPTHIFVQAGVGSLAGAVVGYFSNLYKDNPPKFVVVEAEAAACLYKGAAAGDGKPRIVDGDLQTIMAGLACGEPNTLSWDILKNHVTTFVAAPDWVAAQGMRMLGAPIKGDTPVVSGESGAVPFGALATIMTDDDYKDVRQQLGLNADSQVLVFSTEGDTDPERYQNIVWKGLDK
jgi:diaminopropionate ammonia-lyase